MKKYNLLLFVFLVVNFGFISWVDRSYGNDYLIQVDPLSHQKFGLYYPATYKFGIPPGANGLTAQFKYTLDGTWNALPEKTSSDTFNGIDAVRFDYVGGWAYVSTSFSRSSDYVYLRIVDGAGQPVDMTFNSIPKYYDGRTAAVSITLDDWSDFCDSYFRTATDYLASYGLYFTVGLITGNTSPSTWNSIQEKITLHGDYLEIASHSWDHLCDEAGYTATGYQTEIIGSRDAIRNNLAFKANPYIPLYVEPCSYSDPTVVSWVTAGDYLLSRSAGNYFPAGSNFVAWDSTQGRYGRTEVVFDTSNLSDDINLLNGANSAFDRAMTEGGIYLLMDHPYQGHWFDGSYLLQHMNHIKGRTDVWYVPFGQLYLYHFLQEMRGNLSIQPVAAISPAANFTATGTAPLTAAFTDTSTGSITGWLWDFGDATTSTLQNPTHVYGSAGSYTVTLTVTGPGGTNTSTRAFIAGLPPATNAVTPVGGIAATTPAFTFSAVPGATGYQIWLQDYTGATGGPTNISPAQAGCPSGTGTCSFTMGTPLVAGNSYGWAVAVQSATGQGPWSNILNFVVGLPPATNAVTPVGSITATTPAFTFSAVPEATGYQIWLQNYTDGTGGPTNFTPAQAGCGTGTGICSFTMAIPLVAANTYGWAVAVQTAAGQGPWSNILNFGILPTAPTAISPAGGIITSAPEFTFNAIPGANGYQIWLQDYTTATGGPVNITPAQAGCPSGTGTCSFVMPTPLVSTNIYGWAVAAQSSTGQGPWSTVVNFAVE